MPRQKNPTPHKMDSTTHVIFAARRRREKARQSARRSKMDATTVVDESAATSTLSVTLPAVRGATCRHCGDSMPEEGHFRGFCGLGCAGDAGILKAYRDY
jgi:hypothetical protein